MWTVAILALMPALGWSAVTVPVAGAVLVPGEPPGIRLTISATTERIPLPRLRGPVELTVDAMSRRLRLRLSKKDSPGALAARIAAHVGLLCPTVEVREDAVELGCRSRRIEAQITPEGTASYLDINELRGLPWRVGPDAAPSYHYDPWRIGMGQSCPGKSEVAQGECEFKEGHALEAAVHFRAALSTTNRQMACVRLGDLAIGIGDPITASGWYRRAGVFGTFGRIAEARLCELDGHCLDTTEHVMRAFDATGLPEPLRAESSLRAARAEAYAGRLPSAMHIMARQTREHGMTSMCREGGELLCRRILLEAMRTAGASKPAGPAQIVGTKPSMVGYATPPATAPPATTTTQPGLTAAGATSGASLERKAEQDYLEELLEVYLNLPSWEKGPLAVELSEAAGPLAARLGAPGFGGNLMASLAPEVPDGQLSDHLLLTTETFLLGRNWARARIVVEYAQSRLGGGKIDDRRSRKGGSKPAGKSDGKGLNSPRWLNVIRMMKERADEEDVSPEVRAAVEAELAATLTELKTARGALDKAEGVLGSARAAREAASKTQAPAKAGGPAVPPVAVKREPAR